MEVKRGIELLGLVQIFVPCVLSWEDAVNLLLLSLQEPPYKSKADPRSRGKWLFHHHVLHYTLTRDYARIRGFGSGKDSFDLVES